MTVSDVASCFSLCCPYRSCHFVLASPFLSMLLLRAGSHTTPQELTYKLRKAAYHVMISQEAAWYDLPEHSKGVLTTRLAEDANKVSHTLWLVSIVDRDGV